MTEQWTGLVTDHFSWREAECHSDPPVPVPEQYRHNARAVCRELERIRRVLGNRPLTVTDLYRTPAWNEELKRRGYPTADHSQHLYANGADIVPNSATMTTADLGRLVQMLANEPESAVRYIKIYPAHVHFDLRPGPHVIVEGL